MNRPQLHRARHALIVTAVLLSFSAAADKPVETPAPAGLRDCPGFEALRQQEADKIAAKQLKPLDSPPTQPALRKGTAGDDGG